MVTECKDHTLLAGTPLEEAYPASVIVDGEWVGGAHAEWVGGAHVEWVGGSHAEWVGGSHAE